MLDQRMTGMMGNYADSAAVAVRCGSGMKACGSRCIPEGAMCHSDNKGEKKGGINAGHVALAAGAAGAAAIGIRNRKAIGGAIDNAKKGIERRSTHDKLVDKRLSTIREGEKYARDKAKEAKKDPAKESRVADYESQADTLRAKRKATNKARGNVPGIGKVVGKALSETGRSVLSNAKKDVGKLNPFK